MTLIEIIQLIAALAAAVRDIEAIVADLKAKGHPMDVPLSPEHMDVINKVLSHTGMTQPPSDVFIGETLGR